MNNLHETILVVEDDAQIRNFICFALQGDGYACRTADTAAEAMQTCREVLRQFHSRFLRDEPELRGSLNYLRTEDIRTHEFGADMFNGFAGLSFLISIDEPADLQYRPNEWEE